MKIWMQDVSLKILNEKNATSISSILGIIFTKVGDNFIEASLQVVQKVLQPNGILHGGVSCLLAETAGSVAGNYCIEDTHLCVGISLNTHHIRSVNSGRIKARASPCHLGKSTQVWQIPITDEKKRLISTSTLTLAVIKNIYR